MKIALAQFNPTIGDFAGNSARILALSETAKKRGADLAVFSELCLCGYPPQDLLERPSFIDRNQKELKALAKSLTIPSVVGFVGRVKNGTLKSIANKAALLCGGKIVFEQSKMLLPTYDVFDESRYFHPAEKTTNGGVSRPVAWRDDLRRRVERREFLAESALRPRPNCRAFPAGN